MSAVAGEIDFRPDTAEFLRDPFPLLRRMRAEVPVHWSARMEGQVALPAVLRHWKHIELAVAETRIEWLNSMVFRGMHALPLKVSAA